LLGTEKIRYSFLVILLQYWSSALSNESITNALITRLRTTSALDDQDVQAVRSLPVVVKHYQPGQAIVRDGDRPAECCLISKGFCVRSKTTSNGSRQILSIHIPGEIPDLQSLHLHVLDHDLTTLTECTLGFISHVSLREITRRRPNVAEIFWRDTLIDAAMFRDWIVNVGQRPAPSRLAHIIVELRERLKVIGQVQGARFEMPLTQEQIGEAMGITSVHANRIVKQLRDDNVLEFHRGSVSVIDEHKLLELADFDNLYLHQRPSL
jgi:CRP-like cAMP-binding protein